MTIPEMIEVLRQADEGAVIQCKSVRGELWIDCNPRWDFHEYNYRVKPAPTPPREWWVNTYDMGVQVFYHSKEAANRSRGYGYIECVHVREVLE